MFTDLQRFYPVPEATEDPEYRQVLLDNAEYIREHFMESKEMSRHLLNLLAVQYPAKKD